MKENETAVVAYCRSCNREFMVYQTLENTLIELLPMGERAYHPKADCDSRDDK